MRQRKILLIEDDDSLRAAIEVFLTRLEYQVFAFNDVHTAMKKVGSDCDLILSDVMMPGLTGFDLLKYVQEKFQNIPIILMTAFGTIEKAVQAMKNGAYDFLVKPFSLSVLETSINAALLDYPPEGDEVTDSEKSPSIAAKKKKVVIKTSEQFITCNEKMKTIIENLRKVAPSKATVLIQGESGTGKELIAQMIHEFSPRSNRVFVAINCAAMPDTLLESELFGHERGAFTGATSRQIGKFEYSNNGTILLDEISEMSLNMQTKLLRVLQECEIYRVGGVQPIPLNLRVITTTNRDLYQYMRQGHFREDLYYRINVVPIMLPPLRERGDDALIMARDFLNEFSLLHGRPPLEIDHEVRQKILSHSWIGNVRELRNAMERAVLVGNFNVIDDAFHHPSSDTSSSESDSPSLVEPGMSLNDIEKKVILSTLDSFDGNRTKTANQLGISLRTLRNKLKGYGITPDSALSKIGKK